MPMKPSVASFTGAPFEGPFVICNLQSVELVHQSKCMSANECWVGVTWV
jgi:hypothetical protein